MITLFERRRRKLLLFERILIYTGEGRRTSFGRWEGWRERWRIIGAGHDVAVDGVEVFPQVQAVGCVGFVILG